MTLAKKMVYGTVGIDGLYGPSEVVIIADETANPVYVAADLLAQAEHGSMASAVMITTSKKMAGDVNTEIEKQLEGLSGGKLPRMVWKSAVPSPSSIALKKRSI